MSITKRELDIAKQHIRNMYKKLQSKSPSLKLLGETKEQQEINLEVHALTWIGIVKDHPEALEKANEYMEFVIIGSSIFIDLGIVNARGEVNPNFLKP